MFPDCHTSLRAARQSRPPRTSDFPLPRSPCFPHRLLPPHTTTSSSSRFSPRASSPPSFRLVPRIEKRPCPDSPASPSRSRPSPPRRPRRRCRPCTTRGQPTDTSQATWIPRWTTPTGYVRPSFFSDRHYFTVGHAEAMTKRMIIIERHDLRCCLCFSRQFFLCLLSRRLADLPTSPPKPPLSHQQWVVKFKATPSDHDVTARSKIDAMCAEAAGEPGSQINRRFKGRCVNRRSMTVRP